MILSTLSETSAGLGNAAYAMTAALVTSLYVLSSITQMHDVTLFSCTLAKCFLALKVTLARSDLADTSAIPSMQSLMGAQSLLLQPLCFKSMHHHQRQHLLQQTLSCSSNHHRRCRRLFHHHRQRRFCRRHLHRHHPTLTCRKYF